MPEVRDTKLDTLIAVLRWGNSLVFSQIVAAPHSSPCVVRSSEIRVRSANRRRGLGHDPEGQRHVRVDDQLQTVNDALLNSTLLSGTGPAEVNAVLRGTPGWEVETLGLGSHAGEGWVLRVYSGWHPGGGRHGSAPYWRVTSPGGRQVRHHPSRRRTHNELTKTHAV